MNGIGTNEGGRLVFSREGSYDEMAKMCELVADGKFAVSKRSVSMRKVIEVSAVLLICMALSSCSGNRPEKAFMGTWEGAYENEPVELSFMEKGIWIVKLPEETSAGTWTVDPEGNAQMTYDDGKSVATMMNDGRILVRAEDGGGAVMLEKADKKK